MNLPLRKSRSAIQQLVHLLGLARTHVARGETARAEQLFRQVIALDQRNREALEQLVMLCLQRGQPDVAEDFLRQLVSHYPAEPLYCNRLATLLERRGRGADAIDCYRRLLATRPHLSNSRYNLALLLKREGHADEALAEYRACLERKIDHPEQVLSNISVIYSDQHRHEEARQALQAALGHNPDYLPALHNLAQIQEEEGDWAAARQLYQRILQLHPGHAGALAHLANGTRFTDPADPLVNQLRAALERGEPGHGEREELLYAMGKVQDDCRRFDAAFDYYQQANQLSRRRCGAYDRAAQEQFVAELIRTFDQHWLAGVEPVSDAPLVFICGMFRSGSTLLEQVLAAHPALVAGGEINYFQRALKPVPGSFEIGDVASLQLIGSNYLRYLAQHFPAGARVINKRPDNFPYLGLIRALFPRARVLNTLRQPLDNCLSLFFQPLGSSQAYANDLLDIGHYYLQYRRLMTHWKELAGDALLDVSYESLLANPSRAIEETLAFLQLDWHDDCLEFHRAGNRVRTASAHQVRRPLYLSSRDRWHNYARQLDQLRDYLQAAGVPP